MVKNNMERKKTALGFAYYEFTDRYGKECSIQKSSMTVEDAIWFGVNKVDPQILASKVMENGTGWVKYPIHPDVLLHARMHLTIDQVKELIPILQKFAVEGEI